MQLVLTQSLLLLHVYTMGTRDRRAEKARHNSWCHTARATAGPASLVFAPVEGLRQYRAGLLCLQRHLSGHHGQISAAIQLVRV